MNTQPKDKLQIQAFTKYFAQNKKQINPNFNCLTIGSGITCSKLIDRLRDIQDIAIPLVLATYYVEEIIWYELATHQTQANYTAVDAFEAVKKYGITYNQVYTEFCVYETPTN